MHHYALIGPLHKCIEVSGCDMTQCEKIQGTLTVSQGTVKT